jgi:hypothetical protein
MLVINTDMKRCRSQSRCGEITCEVCARRYAGRLAKRIQNTVTGKPFAIQIDLPSLTLADFYAFRGAARNLIDYRRRDDFWWHAFMLQVWLCQNRVRGVGSLGSLIESEVLEAFESRWPTSLRIIDPNALRSEITAIIRPDSLTSANVSGRYQRLKFAIWPRGSRG